MENNKEIYIVLTQTGTIVSQILKAVTGAKYNHSSISLEKDLSQMYSFGRRYTITPLWGGFIRELPRQGLYKRFRNTDAVVLRVSVTAETYEAIKGYLAEMYARKQEYLYNYRGVFFAMFGKIFKRKNRYYCSEFVREILVRFGIVTETQLPYITKPIDFEKLFPNRVYMGKLKNFQYT